MNKDAVNTDTPKTKTKTSESRDATALSPPGSVGQLLRRLPREQPSPALRAAILERARELEAPRRLPTLREQLRTVVPARPWLLAGSLALALMLGFIVAPILDGSRRAATQRASHGPGQGSSQRTEQLERLRSDYRALENELQELRRLVSESQPVVGLGGSDQVDLLIDLRDLVPELAPSGAQARGIPVSYR